MSGTLYVVATPIGNLADLSRRAGEILRQVAAVACEDTRQTAKLMAAVEARKPLLSLHEHNEEQRSGEIVERLLAGEDIALVSDAGTPLVSDPGYRLVEAAIERGVRVSPIPGPSAVMAALAVAGLATDRFVFLGFLPHKAQSRRKLWEEWGQAQATLVCFESPHRILETLAELAEMTPGRRMAACRELTKIYEEVLRGTAAEILTTLAGRPTVKGEFTLVLERTKPNEAVDVTKLVAELEEAGWTPMDAIKEAAKRAGVPKRAVYEQVRLAKG